MSAVQVRDGLPIDKMPEWSGSALQKRPRRPLPFPPPHAGEGRVGAGLQAPVARAERHRSSKSADAGSNPAWSSTRSVFPWPRSSKDERRFPTTEDARSTRVAVSIRRVNWAGAQRRLLSDRPAQPVRIVLSTLRQINAGMAYWGACLASNQDV